MTLPPFLLVEVRAAFRSCSRQHAVRKSFAFTTLQCLNARAPRHSPKHPSVPSTSPPRRHTDLQQNSSEDNTEDSRDLVPSREDERAVDTGRKVDVPLRVIPKSEVGSKVRLSPQERLHIEHLTRHPPPQRPTKGYRENLLVYHLGHGKVNWMVFTRVFATVAIGFVTFIVVPAYYNYGTPVWILGLVWSASLVPLLVTNWATRGVLTEIRLKLPPSARQSAQAAMTYARNLPRDATIEARFQRWTSHTASIIIKIADTLPAQTRFKPVSFKWTGPRVDEGSLIFPNPTEFWVRSKTAQGKAARDTVPGLWEAIYRRLTGTDGAAAQKWKG